MMWIVWVLPGLLGLLVLLLLIAGLRTLLTGRQVSTYRPAPDPERAERCAKALSRMVQYETVSVAGADQREKFLGFHRVLAELFPLVHQHLEKTELNGNLLFRWKGASSEKPIVLMSHQDVVPAEGDWTHGPFSGDIEDGKVWGRGSSDTKCSVFAFFEAV
ncbi:MAG: M20/M25/M40 family metallo-hydrolase, partial [Oscillospiraceae bacterium]|nr:M20/M25/M40 family metallo-hydrolase [Oscillospiraceae bacterium]